MCKAIANNLPNLKHFHIDEANDLLNNRGMMILGQKLTKLEHFSTNARTTTDLGYIYFSKIKTLREGNFKSKYRAYEMSDSTWLRFYRRDFTQSRIFDSNFSKDKCRRNVNLLIRSRGGIHTFGTFGASCIYVGVEKRQRLREA